MIKLIGSQSSIGTYRLRFKNPTESDSGTYRCRFNDYGIETSTDVTLKIF